MNILKCCHVLAVVTLSSGSWNVLPNSVRWFWQLPHVSYLMNLVKYSLLLLWVGRISFSSCYGSCLQQLPSGFTLSFLTCSKIICTNISFVLSLDKQWFILWLAKWKSWLESIIWNSCHQLKMLPTNAV